MKTIELTDKELIALRNMLELMRRDTKRIDPKTNNGHEYEFNYKFFASNKGYLDTITEKVWQAQFD